MLLMELNLTFLYKFFFFKPKIIIAYTWPS